jgi:hypothetical protein
LLGGFQSILTILYYDLLFDHSYNTITFIFYRGLKTLPPWTKLYSSIREPHPNLAIQLMVTRWTHRLYYKVFPRKNKQKMKKYILIQNVNWMLASALVRVLRVLCRMPTPKKAKTANSADSLTRTTSPIMKINRTRNPWRR